MKKIIKIILLIICVIIFIYSSYKVIRWIIDTNNNKEIIERVTKLYDETNDIDNIIKYDYSIKDENDPYYKIIDTKLINAYINSTIEFNSDTVGHILIDNITNYPIVKTNNNDYYLNHNFKKDYNEAGWIFMDYRNNSDMEDDNTIIYGHSRLDGLMFGDLSKMFKKEYLDNPYNYVIKTSTSKYNDLWQVFSIYNIETTNDYIKIIIINDNDRLDFYNLLLNRSTYDFKTSISSKDKIITLSTCYNDIKKTVVHAKLIKRQIKNTK